MSEEPIDEAIDETRFNVKVQQPIKYELACEHNIFCEACVSRALAHYANVENVSTDQEMFEASKLMMNNAFQQNEVAKGMSQMMIDMTDLREESIKDIRAVEQAKAELELNTKRDKEEVQKLRQANKLGTPKQKVVGAVATLLTFAVGYLM